MRTWGGRRRTRLSGPGSRGWSRSVGLVLGLEMSRLARAGRDWHQLIELCTLAGALLADADGVYDPDWYNDRLLPELSDPGPLLRREWPGHVVDDASLAWRRRGRRGRGGQVTRVACQGR